MFWCMRSWAGVAHQPSVIGAAGLTTFIERDRLQLPEEAIPQVKPTFPEILRIARRRSGLPLKGPNGVARLWGVSHPTLLAAERTGNPALARFWAARGLLVLEREKSLAA